MSTPEAKKQFQLNMETIARFAGFPNPPEPAEESLLACRNCGYEFEEWEIKVFHGCCEKCFNKKES